MMRQPFHSPLRGGNKTWQIQLASAPTIAPNKHLDERAGLIRDVAGMPGIGAMKIELSNLLRAGQTSARDVRPAGRGRSSAARNETLEIDALTARQSRHAEALISRPFVERVAHARGELLTP